MTEVDQRRKLYTPHGIDDILGRDSKKIKGDKEECYHPQITMKRKKMRTTFTGRQIFELEKMFETKKYLNAMERTGISRYACEKIFT